MNQLPIPAAPKGQVAVGVSATRRIVFLGHSGFLGRHASAQLRRANPLANIVGASAPDLDLSDGRNVPRLEALVDTDTAIVMAAAVKRQLGDNLDNFERNVAMVANLCRVIASRRPARVLFVSSAAVYGEDQHNLTITEATPVAPETYYGLAKFAGENLLAKAATTNGTSLITLRFPLLYGPGDQRDSYGPSGFAQRALEGRPIELWGEGRELREFLFVEDAARILATLLNSDHQGIVNVASGESHTYEEAVEILRTLGRPVSATHKPRTKPLVDHRFRNDLLLRLIPALEFTSLKEGIQRTLIEESR